MNTKIKLIIIIIFLITGCANSTITKFSSILIDIFLLDDNCKTIIYRYNDLKKEHNKIMSEYKELKLTDELSEKSSLEYEERILDLSFKIDEEYTNLTICNGGRIINTDF